MATCQRSLKGVEPVDNQTAQLPKVKCPFCGYEMPIRFIPKVAHCQGVFVKCKGRNCKREFEIKIDVR